MADSERIFHAHWGPPQNELPEVLATPGITWRGDGIAVAIPSLLVYTSGLELLIICRAKQTQVRDTQHAEATAERLRDLKANGHQVAMLGGEHYDHGFTYRAWFTFTWNGRDLIPTGDITFELGWPEVEHAEHRVAQVREAAARTVVLW